MDLYQVLLIIYAVIGLVVGFTMTAMEIKSGVLNEPGEELVWIPMGIVAWPVFIGLALRDWLKS